MQTSASKQAQINVEVADCGSSSPERLVIEPRGSAAEALCPGAEQPDGHVAGRESGTMGPAGRICVCWGLIGRRGIREVLLAQAARSGKVPLLQRRCRSKLWSAPHVYEPVTSLATATATSTTWSGTFAAFINRALWRRFKPSDRYSNHWELAREPFRSYSFRPAFTTGPWVIWKAYPGILT